MCVCVCVCARSALDARAMFATTGPCNVSLGLESQVHTYPVIRFRSARTPDRDRIGPSGIDIIVRFLFVIFFYVLLVYLCHIHSTYCCCTVRP